MTRMKWLQEAQPLTVIRWAAFACAVIFSLGLAYGLWQTTGHFFVQANEPGGQSSVPIRLEVGTVQPLSNAAPSSQPSAEEPLVKLSIQPTIKREINNAPRPAQNGSSAPTSKPNDSKPNDQDEIWIESDKPQEQSAASNKAMGEIWVEEDQPGNSLPAVAAVPTPEKPSKDLVEARPATSSPQEHCRIVLGNTESTVLRIAKARVVRPSVSESASNQPVAKEPPVPSPWAGSLVLPENSPDVLRKSREITELYQTFTIGGTAIFVKRAESKRPLSSGEVPLSPEPVAHDAVTLTSGEAQVGQGTKEEKEPAREAMVVGWEFPGQTTESPKVDSTTLAITSAKPVFSQRDRLAQRDVHWETMPIQRPIGLASPQPDGQEQDDQKSSSGVVGSSRTPSSAATQETENKDRRVQPLVTSQNDLRSENTLVKVSEFSNQSVPSPRATLASQENQPQSNQNLVEVVPNESRGEEPSFEIIEESGELTVVVRRSKLLRTKVDVYRTAVVDSGICDVVQFTPREISILGKSQGATHVTFWFQDERYRPVTYLVRVTPDPEVEKQQTERYELLESHLAKLFPESKVDLVVVGDKLVVRGQARDAAEAAQIMAIIRGELVRARGVMEGQASDPVGREAAGQALPAIQVINMLRIPGPPQVALKVKIAELNRTAARNFGVDMSLNFDQGKFLIQSLLNLSSGGSASILGNFDGGDLKFGLHYLEEHGVVRLLSEPTLITLSGRPATFIAGGEFAVPTTVGVNGVGAVTTDFRAYGAIITFLPTVLDKDLIRLEVAPEFSQLDTKNKVNGTPGLRTRAVTTTVEMREGQTLAIAGLLDDSMTGNNQGDLPIFNQIFGRRSLSRNETELIILVTPELVHPMEPEEVPPLPGFDVTEPTNHEFYIKGHLEGRPTQEYDSTTWPRLRRRYNAGGPARISGPFGHGE